MKLIQAIELTKTYGRRAVVNNISLEVNSGEIAGLLGQNGAGKSTAFSMVIGMIRPNHGKVFFRGEDITDLPIFVRARMGMGYLSQEPSVFQRLTVEENVLAVLETLKFDYREKTRKMNQVLGELGLTHLLNKKAYTLSGGERRRLEIARAMATSPSLILLDEPFSFIDPIAVAEIQDIILSLKEKGIGILLTDHNVREALSITDHSYIINEGTILTSGTTQKLINDPLARKSYFGENFLSNDIRAPESFESYVGNGEEEGKKEKKRKRKKNLNKL
ncbi:MAG: chain A of ATP binding cassette transporter [Candidatus Scalindua rubra]|uniref:Chain A of ATP binding cassette transporter n=1 Tax=Candidatus Scalindua rubra TaxID=1872076 RepID=A0A1E3XAK2_9BACT|nr:MAG: chain A of ATP binding cassette transporter [Candidatus Scalindua rubra]